MGSSILKTSIFLELLQYFIYYFFTPSLLLSRFYPCRITIICTFKLVDLSSMSLGLSLILFISSPLCTVVWENLLAQFHLCLSLKLSQYTPLGHSVLSLTGWVNILIVWYLFHTSEQIVLLSFLGMFVILFSLSLEFLFQWS